MKVIIIAAGSSTRLAKETSDIPKGLLKINDKSIIEIQLELFQKNQLSDITIITGADKQKFELKNVDYIQDDEFQNHDVLGSLMAAKPIMNNEILISYSDIIFDKNVLQPMLDFKDDIGIAVDLTWEKNYVNREQHPQSQADNVLINGDEILQIRKNISECEKKEKIGEFLGLMKLSKRGSKIFLDKYSELEMSHKGYTLVENGVKLIHRKILLQLKNYFLNFNYLCISIVLLKILFLFQNFFQLNYFLH